MSAVNGFEYLNIILETIQDTIGFDTKGLINKSVELNLVSCARSNSSDIGLPSILRSA